GKGAQISVPQMVLAFGQFGHHFAGLFLGVRVAGGGEQQRAGGKEVAGEVAAQLGTVRAVGRRFPAAQRWSRSNREPRILAEIVEQAPGVQAMHVAAVPFLSVLIDARQQANLGHRERPCFEGRILARKLNGPLKRRDFRRRTGAARGGSVGSRGRRRGTLLRRQFRTAGGRREEGAETPPGQNLRISRYGHVVRLRVRFEKSPEEKARSRKPGL